MPRRSRESAVISDTGYYGMWLSRDGRITAAPDRVITGKGPFRDGGRYWDQTSDLFRVRDEYGGQHSPTERENSPWTPP
jgi:hypothetical protein